MNKFVKYGLKKADHVQINFVESKEISLNVQNNSISDGEESFEKKYFVNVWKDCKRGFVTSDFLNESVIDKAVLVSKINFKDEDFYGLPSVSKIKKVEMVDKKLKFSVDKLVDDAKQIVDIIKEDKIKVSQAGLSLGFDKVSVVNSEGADFSYDSSEKSCFVSAVGKGKEVSMFDDGISSKKDFSVGELCLSVKKKVEDFMNVKKMKVNCDLVSLKPMAFSSLFNYSMLNNFNSREIDKGKSLFQMKDIGLKKFDSSLNIYDDGLLDYGINSRPFDSEGNSVQKNVLVKKGIVENFAFDFFMAKKYGKKATGNSSLTGIKFNNIVFKGKENKFDEALIVENVIGAHTSNQITGDFSVKVDNAYYFKNGEYIPITGFMLQGNMLEVLNNVYSVGKKVKEYSGMYVGDLVSSKMNYTQN